MFYRVARVVHFGEAVRSPPTLVFVPVFLCLRAAIETKTSGDKETHNAYPYNFIELKNADTIGAIWNCKLHDDGK
jgi:hypothetical protein